MIVSAAWEKVPPSPRFPVGGRRRSASGAGRCRCVLNDAGIDGYLTTQPNVVDLLKDDTQRHGGRVDAA
jgi:hypothetical protein